jgi:hypothetical protein
MKATLNGVFEQDASSLATYVACALLPQVMLFSGGA